MAYTTRTHLHFLSLSTQLTCKSISIKLRIICLLYGTIFILISRKKKQHNNNTLNLKWMFLFLFGACILYTCWPIYFVQSIPTFLTNSHRISIEKWTLDPMKWEIDWTFLWPTARSNCNLGRERFLSINNQTKRKRTSSLNENKNENQNESLQQI